MKLDSDDFELFGLPRRFAQDRAQLDARWKALQGEVHPDRFTAQGAAAVEALNDDLLQRRRALLGELQGTLDLREDWPAAAQQVRALMFIERFALDLDRRLEALGQ